MGPACMVWPVRQLWRRCHRRHAAGTSDGRGLGSFLAGDGRPQWCAAAGDLRQLTGQLRWITYRRPCITASLGGQRPAGNRVQPGRDPGPHLAGAAELVTAARRRWQRCPLGPRPATGQGRIQQPAQPPGIGQRRVSCRDPGERGSDTQTGDLHLIRRIPPHEPGPQAQMCQPGRMGRRERPRGLGDDGGGAGRLGRARCQQVPQMPARWPLGHHVRELTLHHSIKDPRQARIAEPTRRPSSGHNRTSAAETGREDPHHDRQGQRLIHRPPYGRPIGNSQPLPQPVPARHHHRTGGRAHLTPGPKRAGAGAIRPRSCLHAAHLPPPHTANPGAIVRLVPEH